MDEGIHQFLGVKPNHFKVFLDNGAFHALSKGWNVTDNDYTEFVEQAKPDWYPIPKDFIPIPSMSVQQQRSFYQRTMQMNRSYRHDGYVPIIHVGRYLDSYLDSIKEDEALRKKSQFGLGGLVPNLLRKPKSPGYELIIESIRKVRNSLKNKKIHVFGIGGVSTLHVAALLRLDSLDSSGWRNRAVHGIIQLPGKGDRMVAKFGSWNIRELSRNEINELRTCSCPACLNYGIKGLKQGGSQGFSNRAIHNLYVLIEEMKLIEKHQRLGDYRDWYQSHLTNSIYKPLIDRLVEGVAGLGH